MIRQLAIGVAIGLALLLLVDALAVRLGAAAGALPTVQGTAPWTISRAAGIIAYVALAASVIAGLALSTGALDRVIPRARSLELHRTLSALALALIALHALALCADRVVRFDLLSVLVPFASPYRGVAVALGVLAAYTALVVHASFGWRKRLRPKVWRRLHYLSFAAYAGALAHGVAAGSDADAAGVRVLHLATATIVLALLAVRVRAATRRIG